MKTLNKSKIATKQLTLKDTEHGKHWGMLLLVVTVFQRCASVLPH